MKTKFKFLLCMYLVLNSIVTIGQVTFHNSVHSVQIKSSWKELTDVAEIELPKNLKFENKLVREYLKRGDKVSIHLGYNGDLKREFVGYVREMEGNIPIKISCEDYSYLLKKNTYNQSFQNASLKDVVSLITKGLPINTEVIDTNLGKFTINNSNGAAVLKFIKENYGLVSYFRHNADDDSSPTLFVGFPYSFVNDAERTIFGLNGKYVNIVSHNLKYQDDIDVKVRIKAISHLANGKKLTVEVGEKGDEGVNIQTRNYPALDKSTLEKYANEELRKVKFDGYRGSLTAFGVPRVEHGETVSITDAEYIDRNASYLVDAVKIEFNDSVYRRQIDIGQKV